MYIDSSFNFDKSLYSFLSMGPVLLLGVVSLLSSLVLEGFSQAMRCTHNALLAIHTGFIGKEGSHYHRERGQKNEYIETLLKMSQDAQYSSWKE